ncbi:hypothetical protein ACDQ55_12025 [Chitinophaga sp. 30R24]|uniref:hypothetical protein n=1 Tax=Chitinophaga sp. 30R24 TaxID=3248838 RepID=UPI003B921419
MKRCFIGLLLMLTGCAYTESNKVIYEKNVLGNIKLFRDENMPSVDLVIAPDEESMFTIVEDCNQVAVDTGNLKILISVRVNDYQNDFFEVRVLDKFSQSPVGAFDKKHIDEKLFDSLSQKSILIYKRP